MLRYLQYFDNIMDLQGTVPNPFKLQLHRVILNTVPNFDSYGGCEPEMEIFQDGLLIYSSNIEMAEMEFRRNQRQMQNRKSRGKFEDVVEDEVADFLFQDKFNVVFKLRDVFVEKDIQIRLLHHARESNQTITMLNIVFNTGFLTPGLIRFQKKDIDTRRDVDNTKFKPEFSMDLILTQVDDNSKFLSYEMFLEVSHSKNFSILSQHLKVTPDPLLVKALELQGHIKLLSRLALQLTNNSIHDAHEMLTELTSSKVSKLVAQELVEIGRNKYQKMKGTRHKRQRSGSALNKLTRVATLEETNNRRYSGDYNSESVEDIVKKHLSPESSVNQTSDNEKLRSGDVKAIERKSEDDRDLEKDLEGLNLPSISPSKTGKEKAVSSAITGASGAVPPPPPISVPQHSGAIPPPPGAVPPPPGMFNIPPPPGSIPLPPGAIPPPPGMFGIPPPPGVFIEAPDEKKVKVRSQLHWSEIRNPGNFRDSLWAEIVSDDTLKGVSLDVQKFEGNKFGCI
jgi:hypothetical protein